MTVIVEVNKSCTHEPAFYFHVSVRPLFLAAKLKWRQILQWGRQSVCYAHLSAFKLQNLLEYLGMNLPRVSQENTSHALEAGEMESWICLIEHVFDELNPLFLSIWMVMMFHQIMIFWNSQNLYWCVYRNCLLKMKKKSHSFITLFRPCIIP